MLHPPKVKILFNLNKVILLIVNCYLFRPVLGDMNW
jgi:hypothetical protein